MPDTRTNGHREPLAVGDTVRLVVPDNPRLHDTAATIRELTAWGAHLHAPAAATGAYRALYAEMRLAVSGKHRVDAVVHQGYTGEVCGICGGLRMRRSGTCETCEDCGSTSGCG